MTLYAPSSETEAYALIAERGATMTQEEIDSVLKKVRTWPKEKQEDAALMLLAMDGLDGVYDLTPEEEADLDEALRELERGEVASDEEVAAVFNRSPG